LLLAREYGMFCALMSEFKYACPVCGQHMMCDSSQGGSTMECPTCFQKIIAPQAPAMDDDSKLIIKGTKVGNERPIPKIPDATPIAAPEKGFPGVTVVLIILICVAAAVGFVYRGTIFKAAAGPTNQVATAPDGKQTAAPAPPKPIVGLASVIFAKGDSLVLESGTTEAEVKDPAKAAFLDAFKADLARPLVFEGPDKLSDLPVYGRVVPGAAGEIQWHGSFQGGLVIGVTLQGLTPDHEYILTLNGDPHRAGNNHLMDQTARNRGERFYDFSTVTTDANGRYHATLGILLPASRYDVCFFVKDTTDFKIILRHDFFQFTVE
jgi:DNA-directed RNA polymerase subunit RPC12/RpoP